MSKPKAAPRATEPIGQPVSSYKRRPPPLPVRVLIGVLLYGVIGPIFRILDKFGRADSLFRMQHEARISGQRKSNPFTGYTPTKHDVFVATYVKSGTNWMMQIAYQLIFHGRAEYDHIHSVIPWPDTKLMGPMRRFAVPLEDSSVRDASPEHKRIIKTHFNWEFLPYSEDARYIIVIRDPKDVFVSSYFFFVKSGSLEPVFRSIAPFYKLFLSDHFPVSGSWAASTASYWAQRHRSNVLILSFKSMKRDLRGTVLKVARFLDIQTSNEMLDRVCEKSSFEYMKSIDKKFSTWNLIPWRADLPMMRRGRQGGSSELLSRDQQRQIDAHFIGELKRLGSDFPYEEFCDVT